MEEHYFSDESIVEQSAAMIEKDGAITNGISIIVTMPRVVDTIEVLLEYGELKAALAELEADREAMPHLYA